MSSSSVTDIERSRLASTGERPDGRVAADRADERARALDARERALTAYEERLIARERALEETVEHMRIALACGRVGLWRWDLGTGHIDWSEEVYRLFGYEPWSVEPSWDFLKTRCIHPDDVERGLRSFEEGRHDGRAYDIEFRTIWPNGEVHWLQSRGCFICDADGKAIRMAGATVDIDRLKRAEQEANEARQRLNTIAEATPGTIFTFRETPDGQISFPYATAHLRDTHGIDPDDLARDPSLMFSRLHPDDYEKVRQSSADSARNLSMWHCQFRHAHPEKGEVWIEAYSSPLREPDGSITWHGIAHDITDLKRAENELVKARRKAEAADHAKSEFLANMSHEIRTPMSAIMGYVDILSTRLKDPDNLQSLETIRTNGHYLLEIIDDILDLSRIEAGKLDLDTKRVEPDRLVLEVKSLMKLRAADKGLELAVDFHGLLPETIETDPTRFRQILINLTENAIKFTNEGEVRIGLRLDAVASKLEIDVRDTGVGIEPHLIEKLFRPFTQADSSLTRRFGGSGLGLSICRALANLLGGDVTVTSKVGEGSCFKVSISTGDLCGVRLRRPEGLELLPSRPAPRTRRLACRVLVVDDRREMRYLAQHMLEEAGAEVELAVDGQDALDRVERAQAHHKPFDAILLDMHMPVLDGYAAAKELRRRGYTKPVIALTANAMKEDERRCLACGCDAYLAKPLDRAVLIDTIASWTQPRGAVLGSIWERHGARDAKSAHATTAQAAKRDADEKREKADKRDSDDKRVLSEPDDRSGTSTPDGDPIRVLIVEDNEDACRMMKLLLSSAGYDVTTAFDGTDGFAAATAQPFDAIVLDLELPGMAGAEIATELRRRGDQESCILIGLSGTRLPEVRWRELGFDHFLLKPARLETLKSLLAGAARSTEDAVTAHAEPPG